ncbi:hypothetical protein Droror1_Dr00011620 [Drosera rotundifolia]
MAMAYEGYDLTLKEYLEKRLSLIHKDETVVNKYTRLDPSFIKKIKDIVVTIRDAHLSGVDHLHLSTETILLAGDRIKIFGFSHVDNPYRRTPVKAEKDYRRIVEIIKKEFDGRHRQDKNVEMPLELKYFLEFLHKERFEDDMKNIQHHPFFLGPEARLFYYLDADTSTNYMARKPSWSRQNFENALTMIPFPREDGIDNWTDRVHKNVDISKVYNFNPAGTPSDDYRRTPQGYLRFCKNVAVHMKGKLQRSVADTSIEVQKLWPGFQFLLHEAMVEANAHVPNMDDFDKYLHLHRSPRTSNISTYT